MSLTESCQTEQEQFLQNLQASDTSKNTTYTYIFTGLALVYILPFVRYLALSTSKSMTLLCLLGITSLVSTAYIMYMVPVSTPVGALSSSTRGSASTQRRQFHALSSTSFLFTSSESPINQYLPYLNGFIGVLLCMAAWAYHTKSDVPQGFWFSLLYPGPTFGVVLMVRRNMVEIQKGLTELNGMRYGYKGA
jgi:hypothetical protein